MKILSSYPKLNSQGNVTLIAETDQDIWNIYSSGLLVPDDTLTCVTTRKISVGMDSDKSSATKSQKKKVSFLIKLAVEAVEHDDRVAEIRIKGRNASPSEYIQMGKYHTVELVPNTKFSIQKDLWDSLYLDSLKQICDNSQNAQTIMLTMQEDLCNVFLLGKNMLLPKKSITSGVKAKKSISSVKQLDKQTKLYFDQIYQLLQLNITLPNIKSCIVGSPGNLKDIFYQYCLEKKDATFDKAKNKIVLVKSASGFKSAILELLNDPEIVAKIQDKNILDELNLLNRFFEHVNKSDNQAVYGSVYVGKAVENCLVAHLLVTDAFIKQSDVFHRKQIMELIEQVKYSRGDVKIFYFENTIAKLNEFGGGIAAILKYPYEIELDE